MTLISKIILATSLLLIAITCSRENNSIKPKGNRQVAIHITQAASNSYDTEFQRAKELGMDVVPITLPWNAIETNAGFDFSILSTINYYYPLNHTKVSLNITPIYAVSSALPGDLQVKSFDDPEVITRFKALLDSIHKRLQATQINNIILGLEVDNYLNNHSTAWASYHALYDSAIVHVKKIWGAAMPVGVETTWISATMVSKKQIQDLNLHSDMMVLSYYPNNADFTVKPPAVVHSDIETVIGLYPSIPVFIVECGYQTSGLCSSSEALQQQFIQEMFKLWDDHAEAINFIGFLWLTDLSDAVVNSLVVDYGASGLPALDAFKGYLQTTGLRTYPGTGSDKSGFVQLKKELSARGW